VANVKSIFNKGDGALGNSGSVSFQFKKMGTFKLKPGGLNAEELEFELIDFGLEELGEGSGDPDSNQDGEEVMILRCAFPDFGNMQKALEDKGITPINAELEWIPTTTISLDEEQAQDVLKLVDKLEQDEDVLKVFHNLA
jgi:transcriptional/translational regulatory protein YebC/TACO1